MRACSPEKIKMRVDKTDWVEELASGFRARQEDDDPGWKTVQDLVAIMGYGQHRVRTAIKRLTEEGRIQVKMGRRMAIDGLMRATTLYRLKEADKCTKP